MDLGIKNFGRNGFWGKMGLGENSLWLKMESRVIMGLGGKNGLMVKMGRG